MTTYFVIILMLIFALKDFSKSRGKFSIAKTIHLIGLVVIFSIHLDSFRIFGGYITNFSDVKKELLNNLPMVDGFVFIVTNFLASLFGIWICYIATGLVNRDEIARSFFVKAILFKIPLTTINSYMMAKQKGMDDSKNGLFITLFLAVVLYGTMFLIYNSNIIKIYFNSKEENNLN